MVKPDLTVRSEDCTHPGRLKIILNKQTGGYVDDTTPRGHFTQSARMNHAGPVPGD